MGHKMWLIGVRMDYTSISVLIVSSDFPYALFLNVAIYFKYIIFVLYYIY